jgi:hypothetical protein
MRATVLLVSHTHWDREWYRTFEAFRARLVDTVDRVLDQLDEDPGWRFLLDGQAIVAEDYLAIRPDQRGRLVEAVTSGRLAIGPWYVQPDSLLPSGESHVRNLLEGRRVAEELGGSSQVAYAPDSFGHPAQFPQLFAGFGLGPFVHWRGNGDEVDRLAPTYRWLAPDGSSVDAYVLTRGYFSAAGLPADPEEAAEALVHIVDSIGRVDGTPVVLMNGVDHMYPQAHTGEVVSSLARRTGWDVRRGLLDELRDLMRSDGGPSFTGELLGGRLANLLPGVWSSRLGLKLANRRAERCLFGWAEPWSAIGRAFGLPDETPALRRARRALLANQAHDSIGGCSQDEVHRQMAARFSTATELSEETSARVLQRLAGMTPDRHVPWDLGLELAVFNPSPVPRSDVVRVPLDGFPLYRITYADVGMHPLSMAATSVQGYEADGRPVRVVPSSDPGRVRSTEECPPLDAEFVAVAVPPFGWRRVRLAPSGAHDDRVDDGRSISNGDNLEVSVAVDGTLSISNGDRHFEGLAAIEDRGDRGDTYDFDPVDQDPGAVLQSAVTERRRHSSGIQRLVVIRVFTVPAALAPDGSRRSSETVSMTVVTEARVAPMVDRVDLRVTLENPALDHRVRLLFPTQEGVEHFRASTTFDAATRSTSVPENHEWWHPPPTTFPHQGWIWVNDLMIGAPGLPESEVTPDGVVAVTLLRGVGWLSHTELGRRPILAGPALVTPDAQCLSGITAEISLRIVDDQDQRGVGGVAACAAADELGLMAVPAGPIPLVPEDSSLLSLEPARLVLSALKPAEDGRGLIVRVLNPTDDDARAVLSVGFDLAGADSVRLDETSDWAEVELTGRELTFPVGPHVLRSVRLLV